MFGGRVRAPPPLALHLAQLPAMASKGTISKAPANRPFESFSWPVTERDYEKSVQWLVRIGPAMPSQQDECRGTQLGLSAWPFMQARAFGPVDQNG